MHEDGNVTIQWIPPMLQQATNVKVAISTFQLLGHVCTGESRDQWGHALQTSHNCFSSARNIF